MLTSLIKVPYDRLEVLQVLGKFCDGSSNFHLIDDLGQVDPKMSDPEKVSKKRTKLSESDVESDDEVAAQKESQLASSQPGSSQSAASSPKKTKDGELYWDLGAKKRLTLRSWKGRQLVDIREFYGEDPKNLLPGKKGLNSYTQSSF